MVTRRQLQQHTAFLLIDVYQQQLLSSDARLLLRMAAVLALTMVLVHQVLVVDGGYRQWLGEGRETTSAEPCPLKVSPSSHECN